MTRTHLAIGACAALLMAAECVIFDQARLILELFAGPSERHALPERPTDADICDAIAVELRRRKLEPVAISFESGFLSPQYGKATPRVDDDRIGLHVHVLRIEEHHFMNPPIRYELGTAVHNVVLRKVDAHWEISTVQDVAYERHAELVRQPPHDRPPFDDATLAPHVPNVGTQCPRRHV